MRNPRPALFLLLCLAVALFAAADSRAELRFGPWVYYAPYYFPPNEACPGRCLMPEEYAPRYESPNPFPPRADGDCRRLTSPPPPMGAECTPGAPPPRRLARATRPAPPTGPPAVRPRSSSTSRVVPAQRSRPHEGSVYPRRAPKTDRGARPRLAPTTPGSQ